MCSPLRTASQEGVKLPRRSDADIRALCRGLTLEVRQDAPFDWNPFILIECR